MLMKKSRSIRILAGLSFLGLGLNFSQAQNFYYDYNPGNPAADNTNIGEIVKKDAIQGQDTVIYRLREAFKLTG
ncbi:MAG: hypothetical protein GXP45_05175 [bacterium]|nr:hypothetical protein [bacterium]